MRTGLQREATPVRSGHGIPGGGLFMAAVQVIPEAGDRSLGARHSSRIVWVLLKYDPLGTMSSLKFENQLPSNLSFPPFNPVNLVFISVKYGTMLVRMLMSQVLVPTQSP